MMRRKSNGPGAFELIEQAVHLLRTAPTASLATFAAGTLPFLLGLFYFWGDMSRGAFAYRHMPGATLGMTLVYLWMQFTQAFFAAQLRAQISGNAGPRLTGRQFLNVFVQQAALQSTALFVLPLALLLCVPAGWVYAFYQNVSALGATRPHSLPLRQLVAQAWNQARLQASQNHLLLLILSGFGICVFLNCALVAFLLPQLVRSFFGVETMFTLSGWSLLNTTFFAVIAGLTYICVAPILTAVYVLRCFYGESLQSGEDLKADLSQFARLRSTTALLALILVAVPALPCPGQEPAAPIASPASEVAPAPMESLDRTIDQVLLQRKYAWRLPREKAPPREQGFLSAWLQQIGEWTRTLWEALDRLMQKLFRLSPRTAKAGSGTGWVTAVNLLLYLLATVLVLALAFLLIRAWRKHHREPAVEAQPLPSVPDLEDENVGADQLPEDGWLQLAAELFEKGELRLAIRALYLGSLAHLAGRNLITLARFKSNRDYQRELDRRAHAIPSLVAAFGENVSVLEAAWYGTHPVDGGLYQRFRENFQRMKGVG